MMNPSTITSYGFDSASSCSGNTKASRQGRAQLIASIPCDLTQQAYCNLPGSQYPWHAVRRFVHENQGLMKRMYGDIRHISILRNEIYNNDIEIEDIEQTAARYSRKSNYHNHRKMKYLHQNRQQQHSDEYENNPKNNDVLLSETTTTTTTSTTTRTTAGSLSSSSPATLTVTTSLPTTTDRVQTTKSSISSLTKTSSLLPNNFKLQNDDIEKLNEFIDNLDNNLESNNISNRNHFEQNTQKNTMSLVDNIKLVPAPNLSQNKTESATISTTLKVVQQIIQSEIESEKASIATEKSKIPEAEIVHQQQQQQQMEKHSTNEDDKSINQKHSFDNNIDQNTENTLQSSKLKNQTDNENIKEKSNPVAVPEENNKLQQKQNEVFVEKKKINSNSNNNKPNIAENHQLFQDTIEKEPPQVMNLRGINACPVKEEVVAPFWANNTRGEVLALLNLYPFEQYVHWEKCTHENKQMYCRDGCRCEQQYRLHRLLAYDPHNECRGIFSDWFRFPSCCICKCYDIPLEFRATSRSPRTSANNNENINSDEYNGNYVGNENIKRQRRHPIDVAEDELKKAVYEHATEDWYRPPSLKDDYEF